MTTTTRHMEIQAALFTDWFQKLISTAAALSSAGRMIVQLYPESNYELQMSPTILQLRTVIPSLRFTPR